MATSKDPDTLSSGRILWTQLGLHASWATGSLVGAAVGVTLLGGLRGLGFLLIALFVVLALDAWRAAPDRITLVLAVGAALLAKAIAPNQMLLVAFSLLTLGLLVRHQLHSRTPA